MNKNIKKNEVSILKPNDFRKELLKLEKAAKTNQNLKKLGVISGSFSDDLLGKKNN